MGKRVFFIAGEKSGDVHAAEVIRRLKELWPDVEIAFWGGSAMAEAVGAQPLVHIRELATIGFWEVVRKLPHFVRLWHRVQRDIASFRPELLVLVDFPGFNMRVAKWAKRRGYSVHYYIAPKAWAWNRRRVYTMAECIDRLYVILPFEEDFFKSFGIRVQYVGNPVMERYLKALHQGGIRPFEERDDDALLLLPGSRLSEVRHILPVMIKAAQRAGRRRVTVSRVKEIPIDVYHRALESAGGGEYEIVDRDIAELLNTHRHGWVASGTATLEAALWDVVQIVLYRVHPITYFVAKRIARVSYVSLVNLILQTPLVPELLQDQMSVKELLKQWERIHRPEEIRRIRQGYADLRHRLGERYPSREVAVSLAEALNKGGGHTT